MKNILVVRIDDRLIHGQVVTSWIKEYPITRIMIIDGELSRNQLMQRIYKAAAPADIMIEIFDLPEAIEVLKGNPINNENYLLLAKTPQIFEQLFESGIQFSKMILGGLGAKPGRTKLIRNVSASEEERKSLRSLIEKGVEVVYQLVPVDRPIDVKSQLEG